MKIRHGVILAALGFLSSLAALYAWTHGLARDRDVLHWVKSHW